MDGILIVDKPQHFTSHDVVALIRKRFGLKKVGHAGTLDPMATGVLVIMLGRSTRGSNLFLADDKEYEGTMVLGAVSDTGDAWGNVSVSGNPSNLSEERIMGTFKEFIGEIEQVPPMYSAIKYKGRKLYDLARRGLRVERKPRKVVIKKLEILNIRLPQIDFSVACSKGTYVRQLCADIGDRLGCGAHLNRLKRTRSGRFSLDSAVNIESLKIMDGSELEKKLLRTE